MTSAVNPSTYSFARVLVPIDLPPVGTDPWVRYEQGELGLEAGAMQALDLAARLASRGTICLLHVPTAIADAVSFAATEGLVTKEGTTQEMEARALSRAELLLQNASAAGRHRHGRSRGAGFRRRCRCAPSGRR